MAKFTDYITAKLIAAYHDEAGSNRDPYVGELLFPAKKKIGLDLSWIKSHSGLPVSLAVSEFDAKTVIRPREGFEITATKMPFFREGKSIREEDRQELLRATELGDAYLNAVLARIYADADDLTKGAAAAVERMRMQLLSSGAINFTDGKGRKVKYDYQFKASHKTALTSANKWDNADAPINGQIESWLQTVEDDTGERPSRAIMTTTTLNYLKANKEVLAELKPLLATSAMPLRNDAIIRWFNEAFGLQVAVYNKKYLNALGGAAAKFFPDNVFTLLPAGSLGNTWYGTTPEEADLMSGNNANVSIVDTGVAITTFKEVDPVNVNTKVSQICLPSFEASDKVFIATVA